MIKIELLFIIVLLFPIESNEFTYDIWHSGMSQQEVEYHAKKNKIKLFIDRNSHDLANNVVSNSVHYVTQLFNEEAKVTLTFTHSSNILYRIYITWEKLTQRESVKLFKDISGILDEKYGKISKTSGKSITVRNGKRCDGTTNGYFKKEKGDDTFLGLATCFNTLSLNYINQSFEQIHEAESKEANKIKPSDVKKL